MIIKFYYFIYFVKNLSNELVGIAPLIVFLQIVLSLISIFMIYIIIKNLTESKFFIRLLTIAFAFFPINIYASSQISSVSLHLLLSLIFFYYFLLILSRQQLKNSSIKI